MTCSESLRLCKKPFSASCSLTESKGQKSSCFPVNKLPHTPLTHAEDVKWMNSPAAAFISSIPSTYWDELCRALQTPSSSLSSDPVLNNRLWSASQVFLLLWGASEACSYKATMLQLSLHSARTGKTGFPAPGSSLCFPVCNSFCCSSAGRVGGSCSRTGGRNPAVHFHVRKMSREK